MERTNIERGEEGGGFSAAAFEVRFNSLGSKTVEMNLRDTGNIFPRILQLVHIFANIVASHKTKFLCITLFLNVVRVRKTK